jgi:hypothetical protein
MTLHMSLRAPERCVAISVPTGIASGLLPLAKTERESLAMTGEGGGATTLHMSLRAPERCVAISVPTNHSGIASSLCSSQ